VPNTNPPVIKDKWVQVPDTSTNGLDVHDTAPKILADDFLCNATGPITQIKVWGSWLNDSNVPAPCFTLGIWSDVPPAGNGPSHPGNLLWTKRFYADGYSYLPYAAGVNEHFYDPDNQINGLIGADTKIWEYTFSIPIDKACWQTNGTIYWLSLYADCFPTTICLDGRHAHQLER